MEDFLRTINLILGSVVLTWLLSRKKFRPQYYVAGSLRRDIWYMTIFFLLASIVGTLEQLFNTGTYFRVVFLMIALFDTLLLLIRPQKDWEEPSEESSR